MFNQYSFPILSLALILLTGLMLLRKNPRLNDYLAFAGIVAGFFVVWLVLHPVQTPLMEDAKKVKSMIGAGKPVLLQFQSPYCIGCTAVKPAVDSLEEEVGDRLLIIRLNIQEEVGQELAPVYGFEYTPTFIFFDAEGKELWRTVGTFDSQKVRDSLKE